MTELSAVSSTDLIASELADSGYFGTSQSDSHPAQRLAVAEGYDPFKDLDQAASSGVPQARLTAAKWYEQFKEQIHLKLLSRLNFNEVLNLAEDKRRSEIRGVLLQLVAEERGTLPGPVDQERLIQDLPERRARAGAP